MMGPASKRPVPESIAAGGVAIARSILARVARDGGCTLRPGEPAPKGGFMVSLPAARGMADALPWSGEAGAGAAAVVAAWVDHVMPAILSRADLWIGAWIEAGVLYLDVSEQIADAGAAVTAGRARDQIAIWDVAAAVAIPTGGSGVVDRKVA